MYNTSAQELENNVSNSEFNACIVLKVILLRIYVRNKRASIDSEIEVDVGDTHTFYRLILWVDEVEAKLKEIKERKISSRLDFSKHLLVCSKWRDDLKVQVFI